jgi:hypothetical protein
MVSAKMEEQKDYSTAATAITEATTATTNTADLLVSFAEQNSYLDFKIHTQLREILRHRIFLESYNNKTH